MHTLYCEANGSHSRNPENSTMLLEENNRRISHRAHGWEGGGGKNTSLWKDSHTDLEVYSIVWRKDPITCFFFAGSERMRDMLMDHSDKILKV